jgi:hypothetical protein
LSLARLCTHAARVLAELEDSSPEIVRMRLRTLVRQVTVNADGKVTVERTCEPLVMEELAGAKRLEGSAAEVVRRMLVPGGRTSGYLTVRPELLVPIAGEWAA